MELFRLMNERRYDAAQTAVLVIAFVGLGMSFSMRGPTLLDLQQQLNETLPNMAFSMNARALGHATGAVAMGLLYPKLDFMLTSFLTLILAAVSTIAVPFASDLGQAVVSFAMYGLSFGFFETGSTVYLFNIWDAKAAPFLQMLQMSYGVGSLTGPLIAAPFLTHVVHEATHLLYPYSIVAAYVCVCGFLILLLWVLGRDRKGDAASEKRAIVPASRPETITIVAGDRDRHGHWKMLVNGMTILFIHLYMGIVTCIGTYITTFAVTSDLRLSKEQGSDLTTIFWTALTLTRLVSIFTIQRIGNTLFLMMCLALMSVASTILLVSGNESALMLTLGVGMMGSGVSCLFGCIYVFLNKWTALSSRVASFVTVGGSMGEVIFPVIISVYIDSSPVALFWVSGLCTLAMILLFACMSAVCHFVFKAAAMIELRPQLMRNMSVESGSFSLP